MKDDETCKWGLLGAGDVCEKKAGPPLYKLPGHRLVGVTRRTAEKGQDFARRHGPSRFVPTVEDLLAIPEINAVYVATPPATHAEHTLAAARAGKHVLVEKPMAMNAAECAEMVSACREQGVQLGVAYYRRGYPSILRTLDLIRQGAIGQLQHIHLNDQFPPSHRLDLVHFFAGNLAELRTESVKEGAILHALSESGVNITMNVGWNEHPGKPEQLRLSGSGGEIWIDDLKGGHISGSVEESFPPLPWTHWGLIENFGLALQGKMPMACSGEEGRKSTVVLDFVSAAEPDGPSLKIDYDSPPLPHIGRCRDWNLLG